MSGLSRSARLGLGLLLAGGLTLVALGATRVSNWMQRKGTLASAQENAAQSDIPAIDLAAPEGTETATFALG